jgi:hypothetical protein
LDFRSHREHVKKIAVVTDSHLGDFAEHLVSHFISAEVRQFPAGQGGTVAIVASAPAG